MAASTDGMGRVRSGGTSCSACSAEANAHRGRSRGRVPETAIDAARDALLAAKLPPASLTLRGHVQRPVRIVRDATGTAHVYAETARDLFVGYGFALAQDRLWQIDYYRRRGSGGWPRCSGRPPSPRTAAIGCSGSASSRTRSSPP